jgi:hypothetical protein
MNLDEFLGMQKPRAAAGKPPPPAEQQYTAKDFQLEALGKLAEIQALTESLTEAWGNEARASKEESKLPKLDGRALIALAAILLSIAGYVIQDARTSSRQDTEIEATKVRIGNLERIEAVTSEARIRSEVELKELHSGQEEIKQLLEQHEGHTSRQK